MTNPKDKQERAGAVGETDRARDFLIDFANKHFADCTFTHYIKHELAGDFASNLAAALSHQPAQGIDDDKTT